MLNENNYYVLVNDIKTGENKFFICFAKNERIAKVKTYDKYGRNIKFIEITKM